MALTPVAAKAMNGFGDSQKGLTVYNVTSTYPAAAWASSTGLQRVANRVEFGIGMAPCVADGNPADSPILAIRAGHFSYSGPAYEIANFVSGALVRVPGESIAVTGSVSARKATGTFRQWGPRCNSGAIHFTAAP
jgi:hypothetical protein